MPRLYWDQEAKDRGEPGWQPVPPRSARRHYIQPQDTIDPLYSHADGRHYTSKSRMLREQRAQGFVEVGNERFEQRRYEPSEREIRHEVERAFAAYD